MAEGDGLEDPVGHQAEAADLRVDFQGEAEVLVVVGAVVLGRLNNLGLCIFFIVAFSSC